MLVTCEDHKQGKACMKWVCERTHVGCPKVKIHFAGSRDHDHFSENGPLLLGESGLPLFLANFLDLYLPLVSRLAGGHICILLKKAAQFSWTVQSSHYNFGLIITISDGKAVHNNLYIIHTLLVPMVRNADRKGPTIGLFPAQWIHGA